MSPLAPLNGLSPLCDVAGATADLADELLGDRLGSAAAMTEHALERLRRRMDGAQAVFWIVTGAGVRRAVHVGDLAPAARATVGEVVNGAVAIERLRRRNGTIIGRLGEVSGVEELVPEGVRSFLATAGTRQGAVTCVLVLGWADAVPPCDETATGHLRIAAMLLARTLADADRSGNQFFLHEAALASLSNQIVLVDRQGIVIAVNPAWTEFGGRMGIASAAAIGPGVSYVEVCRRAAADGSPEAAATLEGIEAVCGGASALFETAYPFHALGEERWCLMTVTPLRRPEGGAVISHTDVTRQAVMELARRVSERRFRHLADTFPVPVWIVAPDGRLMYGNQAWVDATGGTCDRPAGGWMEAGHPDDRGAAMSALRSAASRRERFDVEVRLQAADGSYCWWSFAGAPQLALDGRLESYVGICINASERHEVRRSLDEVRAKLVAAQAAERSRIARELHDDIGQQLALVASQLDAVTRQGQLSRNGIPAGLAEARKGLQELATSVHNLSHELHPAKLRLLGLGPTLGALCRRISAASGKDITFASEGLASDLAADRALCIFSVAQEALRNAVTHSGARSIGVHLSGTASQLTLRITDDGAGFDPMALRPQGLGLLTMRERVELIGGRLSIDTRRARGTTIEASIPTSSSAGSAV